MTYLELLLSGWAIVALMMFGLWLLQKWIKDAGIVDVGWAAGLGIIAVFYAFYASGWEARRAVVGFLAAIWSFRLAGYLLFTRVIGKPEDGRYQTLRKDWGNSAQLKFFFFFQIQGLLDVILSLPFLVLLNNPHPSFHLSELVGIVIWLVAVLGETVADRQLSYFRSQPSNKGKTCRTGLWRYSRHPNYFFEWLHWLAYVAMGLTADYGYLTLISPLLMLYFILKVTGIPPTEAQALLSRGDDYRQYQKTTNAFFPWFPKEDRS